MRRVWLVGVVTTLLLAVPSVASASLVISELRLRGSNQQQDEFIEVHNTGDSPFVVQATDGSAGFSLVASDGVARATIPNGTLIPPHGHYLAVDSVAYSLAAYPAGLGTTAVGDVTFVDDIPDNAGVALFNTSFPANFVLGNRLDAVGSVDETNALYREGAGHPALIGFNTDHSFVRVEREGAPVDTNDNAADFLYVDTNGTNQGAGQRLGGPGPENLSSPRTAGPDLQVELADPSAEAAAPPNTVRDLTQDAANNSYFGTIEFRRRITNTSPDNLSRLRFRIVDLSTFPEPSGTADLRARTSTDVIATINGVSTTVRGTVLEQPPGQYNGGGVNSSMSVGVVTLATPLAPGDSIVVRFLFGVQQLGDYAFCALGESLPGTTSRFGQTGQTDGDGSEGCDPPPDAAACDEALDLVGCWRFGEASGTTALDSSAAGNHGSYVNGPVLGAPGVAGADTAVSMDGVNDHVVVPDSPSLDVGDSFTLEGWIKRDEDGHTHQLFNKGGRGFHLLVMDRFNGNQVWLRKAGVATIVRTTGAGVPADGQFHHVVATKDGPNSARIYVDGVAQALQQVSSAQVIQDTAFGLFFSSTASGNPVDGVLDEFAVYDSALTAAQVQARFANAPTSTSMASATAERRSTAGTSAAASGGADGCADLGRPDSGVTGIRARGLSCERAAYLMSGGPARLHTAGLDCTVTREDFSTAVVRITRECTGSDGRRLTYTTLS